MSDEEILAYNQTVGQWEQVYCEERASELVNGAKNLDAPINSPYSDHCLYFTGENWEFAYWTSTRPGGFGNKDLWYLPYSSIEHIR